jgi:hypothetical protein
LVKVHSITEGLFATGIDTKWQWWSAFRVQEAGQGQSTLSILLALDHIRAKRRFAARY